MRGDRALRQSQHRLLFERLLTAFLLGVLTMTAFATPPIVIAHRGASGYLPEHTLPAVTAAHIMGADFIEQDIVLSKDGVPIALHDVYLDATTNVAHHYSERARSDGRFYAMDFTLSEIKALSVHERVNLDGSTVFPNRFPSIDLGLRIPTLEEEIELISGLNQSRGLNTGFYIELKAPALHDEAGLDIARAVLGVLDKYQLNNAAAPVFLQCFNPNTLKRLKNELGSPLPMIQLIADNDWGEDTATDYDWLRTDAGLDDVASYADGIGPWIPQLFSEESLTRDLVGRAQARDLLVHPYTLRVDALPSGFESFDQLQKALFIELGVDGAFSDFTDRTRAFIDHHILSEHAVPRDLKEH